MNKIIFVCYLHGFGGESLCHRISSSNKCIELQAKKILGRTVILNDFFEKNFLKSSLKHENILKLYETYKKQNHDKYLVVPTHYYYDQLKRYFKDERFITVAAPVSNLGLESVFNHIYKSFWQYSSSNYMEVAGEILNMMDEYGIRDSNKNKLAIEILKKYKTSITFGGIRCVLKNLLPTIDNQKRLFEDYKKNFFEFCKTRRISQLSAELKEKTLIVPYEQIKTIPVEKIISKLELQN